MITFKILGAKYEIPTRWEDVTFQKQTELLKSDNTLLAYISIFTGIPSETLRKAELRNLESISMALSFLTIPPKYESEPTKMVGPYTLPKDITIQSLAQFEDLRGAMAEAPKQLTTIEEHLQMNELYLKACAIYVQKIADGTYDYSQVPKYMGQLRNYSCIEVVQTGAFFFIQAIKYVNEYQESLPEYNPTAEEVASGLARLSEVFGFSATLFKTSERMSIDPNDFMTWTVREFYHLVRFHAWESQGEREYSKMMANKK